jgi:hypothetical protein
MNVILLAKASNSATRCASESSLPVPFHLSAVTLHLRNLKLVPVVYSNCPNNATILLLLFSVNEVLSLLCRKSFHNAVTF